MTEYIATHNTSPYVSAYPWSDGVGWGTKYSAPATPPAAQGVGAEFSPGANDAAVSHASSPYVTAWPFFAGFGAKYSDPGTLPYGTGYSVRFSSTGEDVGVASSVTSPYLAVYPWSMGSGFGTKYSDPGTAPAGSCYDIAFATGGTDVAVCHATTPFVTAYPFEPGTGFGSKYSDPGTLPGTITGFAAVIFSNSSDDIAVASNATPYIQTYPWSASGFGTKYTNPASLPAGTSYGVKFTPNDDVVATVQNNPTKTAFYPWESGTGYGTKYSQPGTAPAGAAYAVSFTASGEDVGIASASSPYVQAYPWTVGGGFGSKYSDPASLPPNTCTGGGFNLAGASLEYAWNPVKINTNVVLSNSNRTAYTGVSATNNTAISAWEKSSGKWYFEIIVDSIASASSLGICDQSGSTDFDKTIRSGWNESWAILPYSSTVIRAYHDGLYDNITVGSDPTANGTVYGFAVDLAAGKVWVSMDGSWIQGDPETETDPLYDDASLVGLTISACCSLRYNTNQMTSYFKESQLTYSPPSGYAPLDGEAASALILSSFFMVM